MQILIRPQAFCLIIALMNDLDQATTLLKDVPSILKLKCFTMSLVYQKSLSLMPFNYW